MNQQEAMMIAFRELQDYQYAPNYFSLLNNRMNELMYPIDHETLRSDAASGKISFHISHGNQYNPDTVRVEYSGCYNANELIRRMEYILSAFATQTATSQGKCV